MKYPQKSFALARLNRRVRSSHILAEIVYAFLSVLCCPVMTSALEKQLGESPSQVLVLYNADWKGRRPLLNSNQDSKAVAEHYVRMHMNPVSGEKPYMLGLTGKRLLSSVFAKERLEEQSNDNGCGVIYQPAESVKPISACEMRDSRLVEVTLPKSDIPWDMHSLRLELEPGPSSDQGNVLLVDNGVSLHPAAVKVQHQGEWHIRAIGKLFMLGPFTAIAQCADAQGKMHEWSARYHDIEHASCSATGPDGVRDDQNYLDCVENPIKMFLEDPANARPDGTLLKDHILYFVVCYGLPRTVSAPFGIATGINNILSDFGTNIDFGQRLQIMYYDFEQVCRNQVLPMRLGPRVPSQKEAFRDYLFRTPFAKPLWGGDINPFLHSKAYQKDKSKPGVDPPRFTSVQRALRRDRHIFFAMRIDGVGPFEAMELVDRAVYASRYAGPMMGLLSDAPLSEDKSRTGEIGPQSPARLFWDLGFRHLLQHPQGWVRLELFKLAPETGFLNTDNVFLPGGIATFVQSSQGWNAKDSRFHEYLRQGVTVTAGSAMCGAPGVTPHIHSHSFWDEEILYPYLLRGFPMGEILLANQIHVNWITSFVGDPLYRLPAEPQRPSALTGLTWEANVRVETMRDPQQGRGYLVMADLGATAGDPRAVQMRMAPAGGGAKGKAYLFERFSSRPYVFIPGKEADASEQWRMELMDPFGQRIALEGRLQ